MADEPSEFTALMVRVSQGEEQAFQEIYDRYHKAIRLVIRYHLNRSPQLRTQFDSIDFLQEIFKDLFAHPEKLPGFTASKDFLKYLAVVAHHKIEKARRQLTTQKRDLRRTRHLSEPEIAVRVAAVADPQPGPAQQAESREAWLRWLNSLTSRQQNIVLRLRDGCTYQEIAAAQRRSVRSIERVVHKLRDIAPPGVFPKL